MFNKQFLCETFRHSFRPLFPSLPGVVPTRPSWGRLPSPWADDATSWQVLRDKEGSKLTSYPSNWPRSEWSLTPVRLQGPPSAFAATPIAGASSRHFDSTHRWILFEDEPSMRVRVSMHVSTALWLITPCFVRDSDSQGTYSPRRIVVRA